MYFILIILYFILFFKANSLCKIFHKCHNLLHITVLVYSIMWYFFKFKSCSHFLEQQLFNFKNSPKIIVQKGGSVNLTCSYTQDSSHKERDIVRVNVYWRAGNVTGPYAYHPYQEMVHSRYKKRTSITGTANLHINGVKTEDNTTFHCFVVFKVCKGDNQYEDSIVYGGETRLNVEGNVWELLTSYFFILDIWYKLNLKPHQKNAVYCSVGKREFSRQENMI